MDTCIILPYDDSPVARAALCRAAEAMDRGRALYDGLILAVAGVDLAGVERALERAQTIAGPCIPLEAQFLTPTDPIGALEELLHSLPDATLAVPLGASGSSPWFARACRLDVVSAKMLLILSRQEVARAAERRAGGRLSRLAGALGAELRSWRDRDAAYPAPRWPAADIDNARG